MKQTTLKPIRLSYRDVGSFEFNGDDRPVNPFIDLMGVLKGLSLSQDEPDSSAIDAEFFDSPFEIFYEGNPITISFELANYSLEELSPLFGGKFSDGEYEGETYTYTTEKEWTLFFGRGYSSILIYRGLTVATLKKDEDGALNFSVTITSLNFKPQIYRHPIVYSILEPDLIPDIEGGDEFYKFYDVRGVFQYGNQIIENPTVVVVFDENSEDFDNPDYLIGLPYAIRGTKNYYWSYNQNDWYTYAIKSTNDGLIELIVDHLNKKIGKPHFSVLNNPENFEFDPIDGDETTEGFI